MTDTTAATQEKKYRWAWWVFLVGCTPFLFLIPGILMIGFSIWLLFTTVKDNQAEAVGTIGILCLAPLLVILALLILYAFILVFGELLFSYLKIGPSGIEYRKWPNYGLRCKWEDVERKGIHRVFGFIPYDVLYLKRADPVGWQLTMSLRQKLGLRQLLIVSLTGIQGWPNGGLAEQLRNYIPEIMAGHPNDNKEQQMPAS